MDLALPRPRALSWRRGVALYLAINVPLILLLGTFLPHRIDWDVISNAPTAFLRGDLYQPSSVPFVFSPLLALVMVPLAPLGYMGWAVLHGAVLLLLRDTRLIVLAATSAGFVADVRLGNTVTFVFVAGALALRGSRPGSVAYIILCTLMPRPVQLPLLLWLLWRRRNWRVPFLIALPAYAGAVWLTGYADEWIASLLTIGGQQATSVVNWGPTRLVGMAWLPVGIVLAVILAWKGKLGLAGLALSPYVFPQYLLVLLWDWRREKTGDSVSPEVNSSEELRHTTTASGSAS